jgi:hypothetical protein
MAMPDFSRRRKVRNRIFAFAAVYGLLWAVTAIFGVPKTRAIALRAEGEIPADWTDVSYAPAQHSKGPVYYCRASAYAPFLVRADYRFVSGPLLGDGESAFYFWGFGAVFRIFEFQHWMA